MRQLNTKNEQEPCRWRRRKEDRPAEILEAALKIFSGKGFAATRLDEVAKNAGVSKGTLYLYFDSKEALFKAVVREYVLPQIARAEQQAEDYQGTIKELILSLAEDWRKNVIETDISGIPKLIIAESANFPELAQFYMENVIQRGNAFVANLIKLGIKRGEFRQCDTNHVARTFITPMVFAALWKNSLAPFDEGYDINEFLKCSIDNFLRGIKKDD